MTVKSSRNRNHGRGNDSAARWRMRVNKSYNIQTELGKLGNFALLSCGSILLLPDSDGFVPRLERYSHWKETLQESPMWRALHGDIHSRGRLAHAEYPAYKRLEQAIQRLGQMILLSNRVLDDKKSLALLFKFAAFKIFCVRRGFETTIVDQTINYIKWHMKTCQSIFLDAPITVPEMEFDRNELSVSIFVGPLQFVSDILLGRRKRERGFTVDEGRSLAQMASGSRGLPYPSHYQQIASVRESVEILSHAPKPTSVKGIKAHKNGLKQVINLVIQPEDNRTHMSLSTSGCNEASRSQGGRAGYLVKIAKLATSIKADEEILRLLSGKRDPLGQEILNPACAALIKQLIDEKVYVNDITLGDILYVATEDIQDHLSKTMDRKVRVPRNLAKIIANVSGLAVCEFGDYNFKNELGDVNLLGYNPSVFRGKPRFRPSVDRLPTRADVSVEAGMKTRLTTSSPAAVTQIGQMIGNKLRSILSSDLFMKVGFEEPDKLWEVLSQYRKQYNRKRMKALGKESK